MIITKTKNELAQILNPKMKLHYTPTFAKKKNALLSFTHNLSFSLFSRFLFFGDLMILKKYIYLDNIFTHTQSYAYSKKHTHNLILYRCKSISIRHAFFATMCSLLFLIPFSPLPSICSECSQNLFLLYIESSFFFFIQHFFTYQKKKDYQKKMIEFKTGERISEENSLCCIFFKKSLFYVTCFFNTYLLNYSVY